MYWIIVMICDNTAPIVVITNRVKPRISIHLLKALPHIPSLLQPHIRHHTQADVQSIRRPFLLSGATLAMSCRMPNSLTNILLHIIATHHNCCLEKYSRVERKSVPKIKKQTRVFNRQWKCFISLWHVCTNTSYLTSWGHYSSPTSSLNLGIRIAKFYG